MRWSTFGVAERILVPSPAARTTTAAGRLGVTRVASCWWGRRTPAIVTGAGVHRLRPPDSNRDLKAPKACVLPLHQGGPPAPGRGRGVGVPVCPLRAVLVHPTVRNGATSTGPYGPGAYGGVTRPRT